MEGTSRCYWCQKERPKSDFIQRVDERHYGMCRHCLSDILTLRANGKRRLWHTQTHRTCYLCRRVLVASEFTRRSNGSYFSACKECNTHVFAQRRRARLVQAEGEYTVREWLYLLAQHPNCPGCNRLWADILLPMDQCCRKLPGANAVSFQPTRNMAVMRTSLKTECVRMAFIYCQMTKKSWYVTLRFFGRIANFT